MTRPLKFREWDTENKRWYAVSQDNIYRGQLIPKFETRILMQYTGYKSIDDIEVFEGDILSFPDDNHHYFVKWLNQDGCWGVMYSKDTQMAKIGMVRFMQVTGNLYENKELLNDQTPRI